MKRATGSSVLVCKCLDLLGKPVFNLPVETAGIVMMFFEGQGAVCINGMVAVNSPRMKYKRSSNADERYWRSSCPSSDLSSSGRPVDSETWGSIEFLPAPQTWANQDSDE